jgi:hypothetical protein
MKLAKKYDDLEFYPLAKSRKQICNNRLAYFKDLAKKKLQKYNELKQLKENCVKDIMKFKETYIISLTHLVPISVAITLMILGCLRYNLLLSQSHRFLIYRKGINISLQMSLIRIIKVINLEGNL